METIAEVLDRLDSRVHPAKAAHWDPGGLQLGDPAAPVRRVAVCHEVTEQVVGAVVGAGVDLLVSYHPLLFVPTSRLVAGRSPSGRAWRLIGAGTAVAVVHTSFDAAPGGTADALAASVGLSEVEGLGPLDSAPGVKVVTFVPEAAVERVADALAAAGAGTVGGYTGCSFRTPGTGTFTAGSTTRPVLGARGVRTDVEEVRLEMTAPAAREAEVVAALVAAHPYEEPAYDVIDVRSNRGFVGRVGRTDPCSLARMAEIVVSALGGVGLRISGPSERPIQRVAVVPGSGGSLVGEAAASGADVLITGDVSHHRVVEALDRGLAVIDPGHAPSERPGMGRLVATVREAAGEAVDVLDLTDLDPTPWR